MDFDKYVKKKKTPKKDGIGDKPIKISDLQAHIDKNPFVEEYNVNFLKNSLFGMNKIKKKKSILTKKL